MRFRMLGSGSKGNACLIQSGPTTILIDAGLPVRTLIAYIKDSTLTLDAILITHEHSDHVKGLKSLLKTFHAPLYTTQKTFNALDLFAHEAGLNPVTPYTPFYIHDVLVMPYPIRHDALDPLGFIFQVNDLKLVYMVDTGYVPDTDTHLFKNADAYIIESNYDVKMLFDSARPYYLKKRIDSPAGHLSNHDASYHLSQWIGQSTKVVCFAHLSEDCNTVDRVTETFTDIAKSFNVNIDPIKTYTAAVDALPWTEIKGDHDA